jgi:hypothetical protein
MGIKNKFAKPKRCCLWVDEDGTRCTVDVSDRTNAKYCLTHKKKVEHAQSQKYLKIKQAKEKRNASSTTRGNNKEIKTSS